MSWLPTVPAPGPDTAFGFRMGSAFRIRRHAFNPRTCTGPSEVIDPKAYAWRDLGWAGRSWDEAVIYELHIGTFTPEGTFRAAIGELDHLVDLGVTAVEIMPVADFPGRRNWGYDGVLLYAPDSTYGRPEDLKALIDAAHQRGLMVFLDVVYNHFGPDGNYLRELCADLLHRAAQDTVGRRNQLRRRGKRPRARLHDRKCAVLDRGVPSRWASA